MKGRRRDFVQAVAGLGAGVLLPGPAAQGQPGGAKKPDTVDASDRIIADTASGKLRGMVRSGIYSFRGIPYGASTGGAYRFRPPQPAQPWTGIRNALSYGRACIQPGSDSAHFDYDGRNRPGDEFGFLVHAGANRLVPGEDCLQLNVWSPGLRDGAKRPVMVFYHGGGFETGFDGDLASYDGENLARNDVVVVTCNHRLNLFGYLDLHTLTGGGFTANAGLLDLVAVLEWVKTNIGRFGGDAGNVTIFGQSGGGGKVLCLMAMPSAKGLFHRAIVQSGPFLRAQAPERAQETAEEFLRQLGVPRGEAERLQQIPVDRLVGAGVETMKKMIPSRPVLRRSYDEYGWRPVLDGSVLPHDLFSPGAPEVSAHVPLMTGTVFNEITSALSNPADTAMTEERLQSEVAGAYGAASRDIVAAYRKSWPSATPFEVYAAIAAHPFRYSAQQHAVRKAALRGAPSYVYVYNWRTPMLDGRPGTFHACDLGFTFDNAALCDHYSGGTPRALAMSRRIVDALVAFARTGDPNHAGLPHWPAFDRADGPTMVFDDHSQVRGALEAEGLALAARA